LPISGYRNSCVATDFNFFSQNASSDIVVVLVANKIDYPAESRIISTEEGRAAAAKLGIPYFETSAKLGKGVNEVFTTVSALAYEFSKKPKESSVDVKPAPASSGGGCAC
jgi:GTPase SAR1 family protein